MQQQKKSVSWDGPNKRRVRVTKVQYVQQAQRANFISSDPFMLTFAGAPAHFERAIVARGLTTDSSIITIQDCCYKGKEGEEVLRRLLKTRNELLPYMSIWPSSLSSFARNYAGDKANIPAFTRSSIPKWYRKTNFRAEMEFFQGVDAAAFEVLDIDICGIFSPENATDIARLMHNQKLADQGLLFVNHLKGRDSRKGKVFAFLKRYFDTCPYFNYRDIRDKTTGIRLNLSEENDFSYDCFRYVLVPVFYTCEAFKAGYNLQVERLIEYRDRNHRGAGVNMLQWFFRFEKLDSKDIGLTEADKEYAELRPLEVSELTDNLDYIKKMRYPYSRLID